MMSRYRVWLDDASLEEISPQIYVSDISYAAASPSYTASRIGMTDGQRTGDGDYYDGAMIVVSFAIREYNTAARQAILQNVAAWAAKGGWLKTSDRPDQMIYVRCNKLPAISSVLRWTQSLSIEFAAYDFPFWVDVEPVSVTVANGDTETFFLGGIRRNYAEFTLTAGAAITSITLRVGDTTLALSSLSVSSGDTVTLSYTPDHHIMELKHGTTSILDKRTATSDDDLIAEVGENEVELTTDGTASCTVTVRGVYV